MKKSVLISILASCFLMPAALLNGCKKKNDAVSPAPTITGFSTSIAGIGYPLIVSGTNFSPVIANNTVTINGKVAVVTAASATKLTIVIPDAATSGKIAITINAQTVTSADNVQIEKLVVTTLAGNGSIGSVDGPVIRPVLMQYGVLLKMATEIFT